MGGRVTLLVLSRLCRNEGALDVALREVRTCERVAAQMLSPGAATGGLAGGTEGAGATAQGEGERAGSRL